MYKKQKKSWVKHLDFLILDLLCLEVTFYLSCVIRLGNLHNDPGMSEYYNRLAIVLLLIDGCIVFLTEAYTGILRRNRLQELKAVIFHCSTVFCGRYRLCLGNEAVGNLFAAGNSGILGAVDCRRVFFPLPVEDLHPPAYDSQRALL